MSNKLRQYILLTITISILVIVVNNATTGMAKNASSETTDSAMSQRVNANDKEGTDWSAISAVATFFGAPANIIIATVAVLQIRAYRLQGKIDKHCGQLRELFRKWKDSLCLPPMTGFEIVDFPEKDKIAQKYIPILSLQDDPLFYDIKNHLPTKFNNHMERWEYYKNIIKKYFQKQNDVINNIKILIFDEKKSFSAESVYLKAIDLLRNKNYYNYENKPFIHAEPKKYVLMYTKNTGEGFYLSEPSTEEEIIKIREQHEKISNDVKNKFENDLKDIIVMESEIENVYNEVRDNLSKLIEYPEYEPMDCEYIFPRGRGVI